MKRVLFVLGQLSDGDIEWMIENGVKQSVQAGTHLIQQGEPVEDIHIILAGEFRIFNEKNPTYTVAHIGSGELVGEMSFLDERPPSVSVVATQDSSVYSLSLTKMKSLLK